MKHSRKTFIYNFKTNFKHHKEYRYCKMSRSSFADKQRLMTSLLYYNPFFCKSGRSRLLL